MKILIIGPFPDPITGQSIANNGLFKGLKNMGHDVRKIDTNTVNGFENLSNQGKIKYYKIFKSGIQLIEGFIKIFFNKFDVIYMTPGQSYMGFVKFIPFIKISNLLNIPFYLHFHGAYFRRMYNDLSNIKKERIKKNLNAAESIIVLGETFKEMFNNIVPSDKILICNNGVSNEIIPSCKEIKNKTNNYKKDNQIKILYLSNLMKTKGILILLESVSQLKKNGYNVHLDIAGNIEPEIEGLINNYLNELKEVVSYHGVVKGKKKKELLLKNYIFCLPTFHPMGEGQPISILEAMINGCAIVTTNHGGIKDIFKDNKNGLYCKKNNIFSTKKAILKTYKNFEDFSKFNYQETLIKYTNKSFIKRIEKILTKQEMS